MLLAGKNLRILSRLKAVLLVMFLPGPVLYSIFTLIFSGPAGRPFRVAVIDQDQTVASRALITALENNNVRVVTTTNEEKDGPPLTPEMAQSFIQSRGKFRVAVVIPKGYHESPDMLHRPDRHKGVILYYDRLEPVEGEIVTGMLQMAAGRSLFQNMFGKIAGGESKLGENPADRSALVKVDKRDVATKRMKIAAKHTFLAGIVPMFLLFSAAGAARSLLEEVDSGEIRRMLAAPISPAHILIGKWLSVTLVSIVQCYAMYLFAWLVFDVAIWEVTGGLLLLTVATSLATTGFGMLLASFCKSPEQLDAIGTIAVLAMSAIGGSMVPRWIMPDIMLTLGLFTINGWSYDGFMALVSGQGLAGIAGKCAVLVAIAVGLTTIASVLLTRRLRGEPAR
jgi:ABC-2 type transport system permease protein